MNKIYITLMACLLLAGCSKFDDKINRNTNLPDKASGTQLLANAMLSLSTLSSSPTGEFLAQYLAETQYPSASLYPEGGTSFYALYQGPLMNIETALNSKDLTAIEGPVNNQIAVAKILKAYYFWHITDRWGDVPYSEAFKGAEDFTPAYDTQESIYNNLFKLLDEANASIVAGNISNDIMYGGDMTKWKKLANTIHMLMALRISNVNAVKGKEEFNKALTAGIMTSNADNFVYKHLADANNQNYWYGEVNRGREWWALTETLVNRLKPVNDPRLMVFGNPVRTGGGYTGLRFGTTTGLPNTTNYSLLGSAIFAQNAPVYLVTYAQALFALAEAAKLGWITGGDVAAKTNYDLAIQNSVLQWTGSTNGVTAMLATPQVAYDPLRAIELIATQRWIHLYMHGYEAWAEWRRTGFPNDMVAPGGVAVPTRQSYVATESFNNTENHKAAIDRQFGGNNDQYGKVWWDKP